MDTLTLGHRHQKGKTLKSGSTIIDRKYIDFIVNGQSLEKLLHIAPYGEIGTFGWSENIEYENKCVDEFLGLEKSELESGRTSFYVCGECGDIGCGAITAKIIVTEKAVIWKDFAYEDLSEEELDFTDYKGIGPFEFDKIEYSITISTLKRKEKTRNSATARLYRLLNISKDEK